MDGGHRNGACGATELDRAARGVWDHYYTGDDDDTEPFTSDIQHAQLALDAVDSRVASLPAGTVKACIDIAAWMEGPDHNRPIPPLTPEQRVALARLAKEDGQ